MERTNASESISVLVNALTSLEEDLKEYQRLLRKKQQLEDKGKYIACKGEMFDCRDCDYYDKEKNDCLRESGRWIG